MQWPTRRHGAAERPWLVPRCSANFREKKIVRYPVRTRLDDGWEILRLVEPFGARDYRVDAAAFQLIASRTRRRSVLTSGFCAPNWIEGHQCGDQSDLCVLFCLFTDMPPGAAYHCGPLTKAKTRLAVCGPVVLAEDATSSVPTKTPPAKRADC